MRTRLTSSSNPVPSPNGRRHRPVLLHEVLRALDVKQDDIILDATLGGAGHAKELLKGLGGNGLFIGFDLDGAAIERARKALAGSKAVVHLVQADFRNLAGELAKLRIKHITKVLFDLGWSSYQLDSGRGFSFLADEPLLMTYADKPAGLTAGEIVNSWSEKSLADVIYGFGGERYARRIARAIVEGRQRNHLRTSRELAELIASHVPARYRKSRIHPATRTFQALRIATNDEFGALAEGLCAAWQMLSPGGRVAAITFHSAEDRLVKQTFLEWEKEGSGKRQSKKPIAPSDEEIAQNPRARSAKLRVIEKVVRRT